jgi:ATP-binding cassette subfamily B protein
MTKLDQCRWPAARLGEGIEVLGRASGLLGHAVDNARDHSTGSPEWLNDYDDGQAPANHLANHLSTRIGDWIEAAADYVGLEAEPVSAPCSELHALICSGWPLLLMVPGGGPPTFLLIVRGGPRSLTVLAPDNGLARLKPETLVDLLLKPLENPRIREIDDFLRRSGVSARRIARAGSTIWKEHLSQHNVEGCWMLRLPPGASFMRQAGEAGIWRQTATMLSLYLLINLLTVAGWWMVGKGALSGRLETQWLAGWALCLLTMGPLLGVMVWSQGVLSVRLGALVKQRLLWGAMKLDLREMREKGAGQLLGTVIESEAVESLALKGGFFALFAGVELTIALCILILGSGSWAVASLLCVWAMLSIAMGARYYKARASWTRTRLRMTHDLVERMEGHRTRLAQESLDDWHKEEDRALAGYAGESERLDRVAALLLSLAPRGALLVSVVALAPDFIAAQAGSSARMAVELGGAVLAYRAFENLANGMVKLAGAAIAWREAGLLFRAAGTREPAPAPNLAVAGAVGGIPRNDLSQSAGRREPIIDARDLGFGHERRPEAVLKACNLEVREGDRLLLEGPSGAGKSTLGSLLSGLRAPSSGVILVRGLDRKTIGLEGWRKRIAAAPQFHENSVLTDTLAFNLLMGRRWPPGPADLEEAEIVCRELGLGALLDRMPLGLFQVVGEVGWQLSHGERARVYIARALLQNADMVILDESFSGLDPAALAVSLDCVLRRAGTLLAIAHL